jgi:hypothetical protein
MLPPPAPPLCCRDAGFAARARFSYAPFFFFRMALFAAVHMMMPAARR